MNPSNSLPQTSPPSDGVDASPLLTYSISDHLLRSRRLLRRRPPPLRGVAARLLRRASSRRLMLREPSVRVRETAAEQLEDRQSDWSYSKPVIILDIIWNLTFVVMAVVVLGLSHEEEPTVPLRLWVSGYGLQYLFRVACVIVQYKIRNERRFPGLQNNEDSDSGLNSKSGSETEDSDDHETEELNSGDENRVAKSLESANTMFSFLWWIIGFYWVTAKGQALIHQSLQLYWLCVTFLVLDVLFLFICVAVACLIGLAVCCRLPCIIAILYTLTDRDGATDEEIDRLPKYKFQRIRDLEKVYSETPESHEGIMTECNTDTPSGRILPHEDAECCICLSAYEDRNELRELPCHHHFHCNCIDKWLYINATCPLCKSNILQTSEEV
ncbi:E3 ubiquitin-protein ligase [Hibiscus syriacus]|uniref:RING-type E3 ubiquitin transferase n=1 Tax=Hibiscus syriacus TaxID=106335 RepID=A0A6A3A2P0_HIBSY|nr:E3 ubiquitin-protein ligase At1g63170-like isoform X2 [Hibiscus syriacus]KAE8697562.1 E3 ubiquitin-protein ligase [Hibiscus syriacus]